MSGISIGELIGTLALNDQFSGPINKVAKEVGFFGDSFGAITGVVGGAIGAVTGMTAAIGALGSRGAAVADVKGAFEDLTEKAGESADLMLGALREGTLGTISDFDLMKMSTGALGAGLVRTKDEMGILAAGAQMLADRTGGDTAQAFEMLTSSMEKGKAAGLRSMGVFVDMEAAVNDHAKALNKNVGDLTQHERATAINAATLAALKGQLDASGPATADFGDQLARGKVAVENFVDSLGLAIATSPVIKAGMDAVGEALSAAFGSSQSSLVETLMGFVNEFAIGLTYVGQVGTTAASVLVTGWYVVKTALLTVAAAIAEQVAQMTESVAKGAEFAAQLPGVSQGVKDFAVGARDLADGMRGAAGSLAEQTKEAFEGVKGNSELQATLDSVSGTLINVREKMEAAREAQAGSISTGTELVNNLNQQGAAAVATGESYWEMMERAAEMYNQTLALAEETAAKELELKNSIALANTTGLDQKLLQIEQERLAELASLQEKLVLYPEIYQQLADMVNEKYRIMGQAARGYHSDIIVQAGNAGFRTRAEMENTVAAAQDTYQRMKASGQFTYSELEKAHKKWKDAENQLNQSSALSTMQTFDLIANAAKTLIRAIFGNSKAGAIATAIIDTAQAVVKALASAPPPLNYGLAAAVGAAGLLQINKIRSTDASLAMGTVGTRFVDWGRESIVALHNEEAVVNKTQGSSLAGMVEDALHSQDQRTLEELRGLREDMDARDRRLPLLLRDASLLANV